MNNVLSVYFVRSDCFCTYYRKFTDRSIRYFDISNNFPQNGWISILRSLNWKLLNRQFINKSCMGRYYDNRKVDSFSDSLSRIQKNPMRKNLEEETYHA